MSVAVEPEPAPLSTRGLGELHDERRLGERFALTFNTRCRTGGGPLSEVWLLDLSRKGCQLFMRSESLQLGQDITVLNLAGATHRGRVAWTAHMKTGIEFDQVIHASAFDRFLAAPPLVEAERADTEPMADQFGRRLAPLPRLERIYRDRR